MAVASSTRSFRASPPVFGLIAPSLVCTYISTRPIVCRSYSRARLSDSVQFLLHELCVEYTVDSWFCWIFHVWSGSCASLKSDSSQGKYGSCNAWLGLHSYSLQKKVPFGQRSRPPATTCRAHSTQHTALHAHRSTTDDSSVAYRMSVAGIRLRSSHGNGAVHTRGGRHSECSALRRVACAPDERLLAFAAAVIRGAVAPERQSGRSGRLTRAYEYFIHLRREAAPGAFIASPRR